MKLIKRPDFNEFRTHGDLSHRVVLALEQWFDVHLKDHYAVHKDDLVRVYGDTRVANNYWMPAPKPDHIHEQAYLIKSSIEPIKDCEHKDVFWSEVRCQWQCADCNKKLRPIKYEVVE